MRLAFLIIIISAIIAAALYPRFMRIEPDNWHVDPLAADDPGGSGVRYVPGIDTPVEIYDVDGTKLLQAFDDAVMDTPRIRRIAGSVSAGRITYVYQSGVMGFQDVTTVDVVQVGAKHTLSILARSALGRSVDDWDSNAKRVTEWLAGMEARLSP